MFVCFFPFRTLFMINMKCFSYVYDTVHFSKLVVANIWASPRHFSIIISAYVSSIFSYVWKSALRSKTIRCWFVHLSVATFHTFSIYHIHTLAARCGFRMRLVIMNFMFVFADRLEIYCKPYAPNSISNSRTKEPTTTTMKNRRKKNDKTTSKLSSRHDHNG